MNATPDRYSPPARALHSLVGLGIVAALVLALIVPEGPRGDPAKLAAIDLHRSVGTLVLLLVLLRIFWRVTHRPPALPAHMSPVERRVTHGIHHLLYLLMVAAPLLGWLFASARGMEALTVPGISLPPLIDQQPRETAHLLHEFHEKAAWGLVILAGLHAAAALKHHFIDKDGLLRRMF